MGSLPRRGVAQAWEPLERRTERAPVLKVDYKCVGSEVDGARPSIRSSRACLQWTCLIHSIVIAITHRAR